jgi:hypothetical protein
MNDQPITKEYFAKRLGELCLRGGSNGFPKNMADQHILLKSTVLTLDQSRSYSEPEINEKLEYWVRNICQNKGIDRVSLRRRLVDLGYLDRSKDGASYRLVQPGPQPQLFEAAIDLLDLVQVIETARSEIARRKNEYLQKRRGA